MEKCCERYICPACGGTGNSPTCERCKAEIVVETPRDEKVKEGA